MRNRNNVFERKMADRFPYFNMINTQIELEFGMSVIAEEGKPENPEKKPSE